jgi:hypothetical protein
MSRPKILLDTNVSAKLLSSSHGFDVERIKQRIANEFDVVVSPRSLLELLRGLADSKTDEHLQIGQRRLRILVGDQAPCVLPFGGHFALRSVLGVEPVVHIEVLEPADFYQWITVVLAARSLSDLLNGLVRLPNDRSYSYGLNRQILIDQMDGDIEIQRNWLNFAKSGSDEYGTSVAWAYLVGVAHGVRLKDMQNMYLAERLSAAYEHQKTCFLKAASNPAFNPTKHDGDFGDFSQLFYLCDPLLHVLTDDAGMKKNCEASDQSKRILLLKEF